MSRRAQIAPIFLVIATLTMLTIVFSVNIVGFQSTAGAAMGGALRSAAIAGLHQFDPVKAACGRYALRISATSSVDCEGNTVSSAGTTAQSVVRDYVADALAGVGSSADYASVFSPALGIAPTIADSSGTAGGTGDGLDVEIINPAYSSGQTNERALNGAFDNSVANCAGAGVYPAGVLSTLDGACYTRATIVLRLTLTLNQTGAGGDIPITRIFAASAGTDIE